VLGVDRDTPQRDVVQALGGIDVIVHLAGVAHRRADADELTATNERWPLQLYRAASEAGVKRFVWLSSIKVLGEVSTRPLLVDAPYAPEDPYAHSKMVAEKALVDAAAVASTQLAIVRPPLIYGPGVKANFLALLKLARLSHLGLPLPLGAARAPRSFVGVRNLVDLIILLTERGNGIYHVSDPEDLCVVDLFSRLGGRAGLMLPVPSAVMRRMAIYTGQLSVYQRLFESLQLDQSATLAALDWQPPVGATQQLEETMAWYLSSS
jgi:nucleoside-diphosphate-sugar epimerase